MTEDEKDYWDNALANLNIKMDDILDKLKAVREDTLSQRITKLEQAMRRPGAP